jgi:hypothetical protein
MKNKQITYHPLCFNCGRENKSGNELKPLTDFLGNEYHICRACEIEAERTRAIRLEQARLAKVNKR